MAKFLISHISANTGPNSFKWSQMVAFLECQLIFEESDPLLVAKFLICNISANTWPNSFKFGSNGSIFRMSADFSGILALPGGQTFD